MKKENHQRIERRATAILSFPLHQECSIDVKGLFEKSNPFYIKQIQIAPVQFESYLLNLQQIWKC